VEPGGAREERSACLRTSPWWRWPAAAWCGPRSGPGVGTQANVLQGVVTGIGFLGAGAIIGQGDLTTGSATAASIWTVGIIGAAAGYGYWDIGIILAAASLAVLAFRASASAGPSPPDGPAGDRGRN